MIELAETGHKAGTRSDRFFGLWQLVGNTPLIKVIYRYEGGEECAVYVKCEHYNLTGSIKDRMALYILQRAYAEGLIAPDDTIVEATSGNTGIAFAAIGKALGHRVRILMPDWLSTERQQLIRSLGADIRLVSKAEGGFLGSIALAEAEYHKGGIFLPRQFENAYNAEAHEKTTGPEICRDLQQHHLVPDAFVAGVGTGGTVMGVGNYLRKINPRVKIHPLEPAESPTLSTGYKVGSHRIQGISDEFIPKVLKLDELDGIVQVSDGDAILMAQRLSRELGLPVGISSGANLLGAIQIQQEMGPEAVVVTVFPDSNKKYLSTDLFREEKTKERDISPRVELLGYEGLSRN